MKRIILLAWLLAFALPAAAQQSTTYAQTANQRTLLPPITSTNATQIINIANSGATQHAVTFTPETPTSGVTIAVSASTDGLGYTSIASSTTSGGATITFAGTYASIKVVATGLTTATAPYDIVYFGMNAVSGASLISGLNSTSAIPVSVDANGYVNTNTTIAGIPSVVVSGTSAVNIAQYNSAAVPAAGLPTIIAACSGATCYTSPVNSGITTITSGSTTTLFSATTAVSLVWCNNLTASSVNLTVTDGSNNYYVGPNFPFTANNNGALFNIPSGGLIMASGLKMSAGTASAVTCHAQGRQ